MIFLDGRRMTLLSNVLLQIPLEIKVNISPPPPPSFYSPFPPPALVFADKYSDFTSLCSLQRRKVFGYVFIITVWPHSCRSDGRATKRKKKEVITEGH